MGPVFFGNIGCIVKMGLPEERGGEGEEKGRREREGEKEMEEYCREGL